MARIRTIKPEFFFDSELAQLDYSVRLFFIGLWIHSDREGRGEDCPKKLKALIFPYDEIDGEVCMKQLSGHFIHRYEVKGKLYFQIKNFKKHQYPHIKEPSSIIPPCKNHASIVQAPYSHSSRPLDKGKGMDNGKGREGKGTETETLSPSFSPPSVPEITAYCAERKNNVNAQRWHDFYASKGWMVGNSKMSDWKAAVRTWESRDNDGVAQVDSQTCFRCGKNGLPPKGRSWELQGKPSCRDCYDKARFS